MSADFVVRNVSEDMIDAYLDDLMKNTEICRCPRCRADVRAQALNNFPPHYVVTDFGDALTRAMTLSSQFQADIVTAIMQGIIVVRENPRH